MSKIKRTRKIFIKHGFNKDKIDKCKDLISQINEDNTIAAISGGNGSGKTSFIKHTIKGYTGNWFTILWKKISWFILKFISMITFGDWKESINQKGSQYNFKIYKINLWRIFNNFTYDVFEKKEDKKLNIEDDKLSEKKEDKKLNTEDNKLNEKIKSILWQSIFINMKISKKSYYYFKKTIEENEVGNYKLKIFIGYKSILKIFILTLPMFAISIFVSIYFKSDLGKVSTTIINIVPILMNFFLFIYKNSFMENINLEKIFKTNLSNDLIHMTLNDIAKDKTIFLHFEDLDRISVNGKTKDVLINIINEIIDNISIIYSVKNLNILIEMNAKILNIIKKENSNTINDINNNNAVEKGMDEFNKKIHSVIELKSQDITTIKKTYGKLYTKNNYSTEWNDIWAKEFFKKIKKENKLSFRFDNEHFKRIEDIISSKEWMNESNHIYIKKYMHDFIDYIIGIKQEEANNEIFIWKSKFVLKGFNFFRIKNSIEEIGKLNNFFKKYNKDVARDYKISFTIIKQFLKEVINSNNVDIRFLRRVSLIGINSNKTSINPIYYIDNKTILKLFNMKKFDIIRELMYFNDIDGENELKSNLERTNMIYLLFSVLGDENNENLLNNLNNIFEMDELKKMIFEKIFRSEKNIGFDSNFFLQGLFSSFLSPKINNDFLNINFKNKIFMDSYFISIFFEKTKNFYNDIMFENIIKYFPIENYSEYVKINFIDILVKLSVMIFIKVLSIKQIIETLRITINKQEEIKNIYYIDNLLKAFWYNNKNYSEINELFLLFKNDKNSILLQSINSIDNLINEKVMNEYVNLQEQTKDEINKITENNFKKINNKKTIIKINELKIIFSNHYSYSLNANISKKTNIDLNKLGEFISNSQKFHSIINLKILECASRLIKKIKGYGFNKKNGCIDYFNNFKMDFLKEWEKEMNMNFEKIDTSELVQNQRNLSRIKKINIKIKDKQEFKYFEVIERKILSKDSFKISWLFDTDKLISYSIDKTSAKNWIKNFSEYEFEL